MTTENILCSVVIPAYNCEKYISETILSALSQSHQNLEIIVIDDCSKDATSRIILDAQKKDSRVICRKNPCNLGVAITRNRGISLASGEYIAFLDCDDIWLPEKIERQLELMQSRNCDVCYTSYELFDQSGAGFRRQYIVPEETDFKRLLKENVIGCSSAVIKADLAKKHSMNPDYAHEDYVYWLELLSGGAKACGLTDILTRYRVRPESRSGNKIKAAGNRWIVYRKFLKYNFFKSLRLFCAYAFNSLKKRGRS
ncbi:MAG: glycosyltransferase [Oscillospiraceae bacterium]|jgi:teichuronic acid biosynthesis glycosyltransferase TuaG|nr:glycosyltransferase [Oscillospiraceae bacterium]